MLIHVDEGFRCFNIQLLMCIRKQKNSEAISIIESLQAEDSINQLKDYQRRTLLHHAVECNSSVIVQYLLGKGCDLEDVDLDGESPLTLAIKLKNFRITSILLDAKNGRFDIEKYIRITAYTFPNDLQLVKLLLDKLTMGCSTDEEVAQKLVDSRCPLAAAVGVFKNARITELMLDRGCPVDSRMAGTGETGLHLAVEYLDSANIRLLVARGAEINARDRKNCTPLSGFEASAGEPDEHVKILRLLLDRGASLTTNFRRRDRYWLHYRNDQNIVAELLSNGHIQILQLLIPRIDFRHRYDNGRTPLHHIVMNASAGALELVRDESFDVNARDSNGYTCLDIAVSRADVNKVRFLLEIGADPNIINNAGLWHVLHLVSKSRVKKQIFELLLFYEADLQISTLTNDNFVLLVSTMRSDLDFAKIIIAHLVRLDDCGAPMDRRIADIIEASGALRDFSRLCRQHLRTMKQTTVHESVTLYKLLNERPKNLVMYARNEAFRSKYARWRESLENHVQSFYVRLLKFRADKAITIAIMKNEAACIICQMIHFPLSMTGVVMENIVDYLTEKDIENLLQV